MNDQIWQIWDSRVLVKWLKAAYFMGNKHGQWHMIIYICLWIYYSYPLSTDNVVFVVVASTISHHRNRNVTCSVLHSASYKPLCSVNIQFLCIIYEVVILFWSIEWIICLNSLVKFLKKRKKQNDTLISRVPRDAERVL